MHLIAFIEDPNIVQKILKHLGLWDLQARPPPRAHAPAVHIHIDDSYSQIPVCEDDLYRDPDCPMETYAS
jgi:hypothetical protein